LKNVRKELLVNNVFSECDGFAFRVPGGAKTGREDLWQRREALKLLFAGAFCRPCLPISLFFSGFAPRCGLRAGVLDAHQNDTVVAMIDQIIPRLRRLCKGRASTKFMTSSSPSGPTTAERRNFLSGLADVDKQSTTLFGKTSRLLLQSNSCLFFAHWTKPRGHRALSPRKPRGRPPIWEPAGRDTQMQTISSTVFKKMTVTAITLRKLVSVRNSSYKSSRSAAWLHQGRPRGGGRVRIEATMATTTYDAMLSARVSPAAGPPRKLTEKGLNTLVLEAGRSIVPERDYVDTFPCGNSSTRMGQSRRA